MEAVASGEVSSDMEEDYKMFLNTCRFVQYAIKSYKSGTVLSFYKRFRKTKRYIPIKGVDYSELIGTNHEPSPSNNNNDNNSIPSKPITEHSSENLEGTPKRGRGRPRLDENQTLQNNQEDSAKKPRGRPRKAQQANILDFSPSTPVFPPCLTPFTNYPFYATTLSTTLSSSNMIHSLCSTIHSEFDLFALTTDLLQNRCLPTYFCSVLYDCIREWMIEMVSSFEHSSITLHLEHYIAWLKRRFHLHLDVLSPFVPL